MTSVRNIMIKSQKKSDEIFLPKIIAHSQLRTVIDGFYDVSFSWYNGRQARPILPRCVDEDVADLNIYDGMRDKVN